MGPIFCRRQQQPHCAARICTASFISDPLHLAFIGASFIYLLQRRRQWNLGLCWHWQDQGFILFKSKARLRSKVFLVGVIKLSFMCKGALSQRCLDFYCVRTLSIDTVEGSSEW